MWWGSVARPRALHDCTTMRLYSHVALSHCAFSTSLVDFHTLNDQPFGPSARAFSFEVDLDYLLDVDVKISNQN